MDKTTISEVEVNEVEVTTTQQPEATTMKDPTTITLNEDEIQRAMMIACAAREWRRAHPGPDDYMSVLDNGTWSSVPDEIAMGFHDMDDAGSLHHLYDPGAYYKGAGYGEKPLVFGRWDALTPSMTLRVYHATHAKARAYFVLNLYSDSADSESRFLAVTPADYIQLLNQLVPLVGNVNGSVRTDRVWRLWVRRSRRTMRRAVWWLKLAAWRLKVAVKQRG
jgi:hypothetical protein